jgi:hypothetical protein
VLRESTSRVLCGLVCPSRTSERGGEGDCVKEGEGGEGQRERDRALEVSIRYLVLGASLSNKLNVIQASTHASKQGS